MTYEYINPCEKGFLRIAVSRKQHNQMLPNRKQRFGAKVEYYWQPEKKIFEAQYFCATWMKIPIIAVMFVPAILMNGIPETLRDTGDLIHERKRGKFSADRFFLGYEKTTDGRLESFIAKAMQDKGGK